MGKTKRFSDDQFSMQRWFAVVGMICIVTWTLISGTVLTFFLTEAMVRRDAEVSRQFVETNLQAMDTREYFTLESGAVDEVEFQSTFLGLAIMPDVFRVVVYNKDRNVIWSNDQSIIGRKIKENPELDEALAGELTVEKGALDESTGKNEHLSFPEDLYGARFIEMYIPILSRDQQDVVGVVEIYKFPLDLFTYLDQGHQILWLSAAAGAAFMFITLFWIVYGYYRGHNIIQRQHLQIMETKKVAALGDLTSVMAHNIRNPLASIRSSAELAQEDPNEWGEGVAEDIIKEVDRMNKWIGDLLTLSKGGETISSHQEINHVIDTCLHEKQKEIKNSGIKVVKNLGSSLPQLAIHTQLNPVIGVLVENAIEAMPSGGELTISSSYDDKKDRVVIDVADTGIGISADIEDKLFTPFYTTKATGKGLGLVLSRSLVEREGGTLNIRSVAGGTVARVELPVES